MNRRDLWLWIALVVGAAVVLLLALYGLFWLIIVLSELSAHPTPSARVS